MLKGVCRVARVPNTNLTIPLVLALVLGHYQPPDNPNGLRAQGNPNLTSPANPKWGPKTTYAFDADILSWSF